MGFKNKQMSSGCDDRLSVSFKINRVKESPCRTWIAELRQTLEKAGAVKSERSGTTDSCTHSDIRPCTL